MNYKEYLEKAKYSRTTIESYTNQVDKFTTWCQRNHTTSESIDYKTCMKYIGYLQRENTNKKTVNHKLGILKNHIKGYFLRFHHTFRYEFSLDCKSFPTKNSSTRFAGMSVYCQLAALDPFLQLPPGVVRKQLGRCLIQPHTSQTVRCL